MATVAAVRRHERTSCDGCLALERRVAALEQARERRSVSAEDHALFVMAIAAAIGGAAFTASELRPHPELQQALGSLTVRQIGKRLRALAGREMAGYVVVRIGREGSGVLWSVQVAHLHTHPSAGAEGRV